MGIQDIWIKKYRDTGYLEKIFGDVNHKKCHFLKELTKFIDQIEDAKVKKKKKTCKFSYFYFSFKY